MQDFDPYHKWLGIPKAEQPANHYRLLGLEIFEFDEEIIEAAADRQMSFIRQYQSGSNSVHAARLLNELATARICLLKPDSKKSYDARLRNLIGTALNDNSDRPLFAVEGHVESRFAQKGKKTGAKRKGRPLPLPWLYAAFAIGTVVAGLVLIIALTGRTTSKIDRNRAAANQADTSPTNPSIVDPAVATQSSPPTLESVIWPQEKLVAQPSGPPVNLLKQFSLERDVAWGEPQQTSTALITGANSLMHLPAGKLPEDYQVKYAIRRLDGSEGLVLGFMMSGRPGMMIIDGWSSNFCGLFVDRREPTDNCTTRRGSLFKDLSISNVVLTVHPGHLHVQFDGQTIVNWHGNPERLSLHLNAFSREALFVMSGPSRFVVESASLIPLQPEPTVVRPKRLDREIDVLPLVDTERDAPRGIWNQGKESLSSPQGWGKIYLPTVVPLEYTLSVEIEMPENHQGPYSCGIGLVSGTSSFQFHFMDRGTIGLDVIDDRRMFQNETTLGGTWLKPGKPIQVDCTVTSAGVRVEIDHQIVVNWQGDSSRLSIAGDWAIADGRRLFLASTSHLKMRKIKLGPPREPEYPPPRKLPAVGQSLDLLALIDPRRDSLLGTWERDGLAVRVMGTEYRSTLLVPVEPPAEYKLTIKLSRETGGMSNKESFWIGLPVAGSKLIFIIDAKDSAFSSISLDDGDYERTPLIFRGAVLPPDKPQELVCLVRRTGVSIMHEGKPLLEWTGNPNRFAIRPDLQSPGGRISLTSWNSRFRIEKLELAPTPATSLPAVLPLGMDGKIISMIRPERDARKGDWVLDGDSLTCKLYSQSRLLIPAMVPSRYVFSGTATRKKGMLDLLIGLVVDGHPCSIPLDGGDGAGLDLLDGATFWEGSNILHRKYPGRLLQHNKPTSFRCFVLPDAIIVECAGKEVVRWHGDARRLSARAQFVPPNYSEPDRKHLWIGGYESEFTFRDLELKPLSDADADRISKSFSGVYPTGPQVTVPLKSLTP